jgi:hypothetical protein
MKGQLTLVYVPAIEAVNENFCRFCNDCDADVYGLGEWYMVRDRIWPDEVPGALCIGCLEARAGRELTPSDFADVPCNRWTPRSQRLLDRLGSDCSTGSAATARQARQRLPEFVVALKRRRRYLSCRFRRRYCL